MAGGGVGVGGVVLRVGEGGGKVGRLKELQKKVGIVLPIALRGRGPP